ncbi:hypothetical protein DIPPA_10629 [Diplonema papillatum]|nr:hypothetical protein DIPPA_10629 [Diplonema papillatum]|eukprot:gene6281-9626_t
MGNCSSPAKAPEKKPEHRPGKPPPAHAGQAKPASAAAAAAPKPAAPAATAPDKKPAEAAPAAPAAADKPKETKTVLLDSGADTGGKSNSRSRDGKHDDSRNRRKERSLKKPLFPPAPPHHEADGQRSPERAQGPENYMRDDERMLNAVKLNDIALLTQVCADKDFEEWIKVAATYAPGTSVNPLMRAVKMSRVACCDVIAKSKGSVALANQRDSNGYTALTVACARGATDLVRCLLQIEGMDVNPVDRHDGRTPLLHTTEPEILQLLAEHNADLFIRDKHGNTILHFFAMYASRGVAIGEGKPRSACPEDLDILKLILDRDMVANVANSTGITAAMVAARFGSPEVIRLLCARGADLALMNQDGETALMLAAINNHASTMKALKECGADLNFSNSYGETALILAVERGEIEPIRYLLEAGVDPTVTDMSGMTAIELAGEEGLQPVIDLFTEFGYEVPEMDDNNDSTKNQTAA